MSKSRLSLIILLFVLMAVQLLVNPNSKASAQTSPFPDSNTSKSPANIQEFDSVDEIIEQIAKETGQSIDDVKKVVEKNRTPTESEDPETRSIEDFWQYIPQCQWGKAYVVFNSSLGAGNVSFLGKPMHVGAWACPSTSCTFLAQTGSLWGDEYIWAVTISGDVSIYSAWCSVNT